MTEQRWHPRRVYVPIERRGVFRTHDGVVYIRDARTSVIRRQIPKVRGKAARRADKRLRRSVTRPLLAAA